jgi:redox-sensitive bicupin YhaK (pirin superfamily)
MSIRPVKRIVQSQPTIEGAGVKLRRAFGFGDTTETDPFLLLDDFRNDRPQDYLAGFPWHPHRGIETITYVLNGTVEHGDSLGNRGILGSGDVQWMTAGRGIMHQEMPQGDARGRMHGFQLWANLPSSLKMTAPRYQDVKAAAIPEIVDNDGTRVRVVCGEFWGKKGPVDGVAADPRYLDVFVPAGQRKTLKVEVEHRAFAYVRIPCSASRSATARWCCSIKATRSPCRPATTASASCWCRASRSRSRLPGMARS